MSLIESSNAFRSSASMGESWYFSNLSKQDRARQNREAPVGPPSPGQEYQASQTPFAQRMDIHHRRDKPVSAASKEQPGYRPGTPAERAAATKRFLLRKKAGLFTARTQIGDSINAFREIEQVCEAVTGRLFGKGGKKPGQKTVQQLRGSATARRTKDYSSAGKEISHLTGEWGKSGVEGASKLRRAQGRREIASQLEPSDQPIKGLGKKKAEPKTRTFVPGPYRSNPGARFSQAVADVKTVRSGRSRNKFYDETDPVG